MSVALKNLIETIGNEEAAFTFIKKYVKEVMVYRVLEEGDDPKDVETYLEARLASVLPIQTIKDTITIDGVAIPVVTKRIIYLDTKGDDNEPNTSATYSSSTALPYNKAD